MSDPRRKSKAWIELNAKWAKWRKQQAKKGPALAIKFSDAPVFKGSRADIVGYRVISDVTVGTKNMGVTIAYLLPGGKIGAHRHNLEEVYVFMQGEGIQTVERKQKIKVKAGMVTYLKPNLEHETINTSDEVMIIVAALSRPPLYWGPPYEPAREGA
jgi:quercetin dioxygenase-like cupin family protein